MAKKVLLLVLLLLSQFAFAESILNSNEQENRAQILFNSIRCPVCEGQSIRDSKAELAVKLRQHIRKKIAAGVADQEIIDELRDSYGDSISFEPELTLHYLALWVVPFATLIILLIYLYGRRF